MDKLRQYRSIVTKILLQHAEYAPSHGQIEPTPVFDELRDHYLLVDVGWDSNGRVYAVALHLAIKNGKIWIERDGTGIGVASQLLEAGIPKEDIVLAFYRPERRALTEFAVA
jgi:hypothetical protein